MDYHPLRGQEWVILKITQLHQCPILIITSHPRTVTVTVPGVGGGDQDQGRRAGSGPQEQRIRLHQTQIESQVKLFFFLASFLVLAFSSS